MTERSFQNRSMLTGEVVTKTYKLKGQSLNDMLSDDLEGTVEYWESENFEKVEPDQFQTIKKGYYVKYITTTGKVRVGGMLMVKEPEYFVLKNMKNSMSWSIQLDKTRAMYVRESTKQTSENSSELKKIKEEQENEFNELMEQEYLNEDTDDVKYSQIKFYRHMRSVPGGEDIKLELVRKFIRSKKRTD